MSRERDLLLLTGGVAVALGLALAAVKLQQRKAVHRRAEQVRAPRGTSAEDASISTDTRTLDHFVSKVWAARRRQVCAPEGVEVHESFEAMGLSDQLLRNVQAYFQGEPPDALQSAAIVPFAGGRDLIIEDPSGAYLTSCISAYSLGILQQLQCTPLPQPQALVLLATREWALSHRMCGMDPYAADLQLRAVTFARGDNKREILRNLQSGVDIPHVVFGTPAMVADLIRRRALHVEHLRILVLDKVDHILARGMKEAVCDIIQWLPEQLQVCLTTGDGPMPAEALEITGKLLTDPVQVRVLPRGDDDPALSLEGVEHFRADVEPAGREGKLCALCGLLDAAPSAQAVVFVNHADDVDWLADSMAARGHTVAATHGGMAHSACDRAVRALLSGASRVLVTTDRLSSGIDEPCWTSIVRDLHPPDQPVSLVINYDLPGGKDPEYGWVWVAPHKYLQRVGQVPRSGRPSIAVNLVSNDVDETVLSRLQEDYHMMKNITIKKLPSNVGDLF